MAVWVAVVIGGFWVLHHCTVRLATTLAITFLYRCTSLLPRSVPEDAQWALSGVSHAACCTLQEAIDQSIAVLSELLTCPSPRPCSQCAGGWPPDLGGVSHRLSNPTPINKQTTLSSHPNYFTFLVPRSVPEDGQQMSAVGSLLLDRCTMVVSCDELRYWHTALTRVGDFWWGAWLRDTILGQVGPWRQDAEVWGGVACRLDPDAYKGLFPGRLRDAILGQVGPSRRPCGRGRGLSGV